MNNNQYIINNILIHIFCFVIFTACSEQTVNVCTCTNPLIDRQAVVICSEVSDGDTWKFLLGADEFSVRVLGIDCFETRRGARLDSQAVAAGITSDSALSLGKQAKALADSLLRGKEVIIFRDSLEDNFDVYGRLLRHCRVGQTNLADTMLRRRLVKKMENISNKIKL